MPKEETMAQNSQPPLANLKPALLPHDVEARRKKRLEDGPPPSRTTREGTIVVSFLLRLAQQKRKNGRQRTAAHARDEMDGDERDE